MDRVELHSHSSVSDGMLEPHSLLRAARRRGCRAVAVTDHDTIRGGVMAYKASKRLGLGVIAVPGVEVRTTWGDVLALCTEPPNGEPPKDPVLLREWADAESCILVAAHPYHPLRHSVGGRRLLEGARMGLWDAVEVWNSRGLPLFNIPAIRASRLLGLPGTSGSDAHVPSELCTSPVIVEAPESPGDVVDAIRRGEARPTPGLAGLRAYAEALGWAVARRLLGSRP